MRAALSVTAYVFHGVPFGPVPAWLFRYSLRFVFAEGFRFCKRPNGIEVGFSLLSLWLVVVEKAGFTVASVVARSIGRATSIPFGGQGRWWLAREGRASGAGCVSRERAGQTESGTRKGGQVVEACVFSLQPACFTGLRLASCPLGFFVTA